MNKYENEFFTHKMYEEFLLKNKDKDFKLDSLFDDNLKTDSAYSFIKSKYFFEKNIFDNNIYDNLLIDYCYENELKLSKKFRIHSLLIPKSIQKNSLEKLKNIGQKTPLEIINKYTCDSESVLKNIYVGNNIIGATNKYIGCVIENDLKVDDGLYELSSDTLKLSDLNNIYKTYPNIYNLIYNSDKQLGLVDIKNSFFPLFNEIIFYKEFFEKYVYNGDIQSFKLNTFDYNINQLHTIFLDVVSIKGFDSIQLKTFEDGKLLINVFYNINEITKNKSINKLIKNKVGLKRMDIILMNVVSGCSVNDLDNFL